MLMFFKVRETGQSKGYSFVRFYSHSDVAKALKLEPPPSFRDEVTKETQAVTIKIGHPKTILYINNLPRDMKAEELQQELTVLGKSTVVKVDLAKYSNGASYGWATYRDHESALAALRSLQRESINGSHLSVSMDEKPKSSNSYREEEDLSVKSVFVKGLHPDIQKEDLEDLFGNSTLEKVIIPLDKETKQPLGHAFVHFNTRQEAEIARDKYNGHDFHGRRIYVNWCQPQSKYKREKERERQYDNRDNGHRRRSGTDYGAHRNRSHGYRRKDDYPAHYDDPDGSPQNSRYHPYK